MASRRRRPCRSCAHPDMIFVFGSNLSGRHGKGAAAHARAFHGAIMGQSWGRMGQSWAIPTKNHKLQPMHLNDIQLYITMFNNYAAARPHLTFDLTKIGCGYAGYSSRQIRPLFVHAPPNVLFPEEWDRQ